MDELLVQGFISSSIRYENDIKQLTAEGSWQELTEVLVQRQAFYEKIFSQLSGTELPDLIVREIKNIQQQDAVSLRLLKAQKKEVERQCMSLRKGRKSVKAYQG